jgi:ubiquitin-protein ligase
MTIEQFFNRLQEELADFSTDSHPNCLAGPSGDDMFHWTGVIMGEKGFFI